MCDSFAVYIGQTAIIRKVGEAILRCTRPSSDDAWAASAPLFPPTAHTSDHRHQREPNPNNGVAADKQPIQSATPKDGYAAEQCPADRLTLLARQPQQVCHSHQLSQRLCAHFSHHLAPMNLYGDLAHSQLGRDLLIQKASADESHYFALAGG
jgi:hypothetical protein